MILVSDCGEYVCVRTGRNFDVIAADGSRIWLTNRVVYNGFDDPRLLHTDIKFQVGEISNNSRTTKRGRYIPDYTITLVELDPDVEIEPYTGNTVLESKTLRFRHVIKRLCRNKNMEVSR